MADTQLRISRELLVGALGATVGAIESRVTDRLVSLLEEDDARAGDALYSVGDPAELFYFARRGSVRLVRPGTAPRTYDGRHVFGMVDALLEQPHTHTAVALTDLEIVRIRATAWIELLEDSFELARASVSSLARSVALLEQQLAARGALPATLDRAPAIAGRAPLNVLDRIAALMLTPVLSRAGVQTLSDLALASEELVFAPGELLFCHDEPKERVLVVVDGAVEATRANPDAVLEAGPGEVVLGAAAFVDLARGWQARATARTRALAFRHEDWFDLMEDHFDMVRSALWALSTRREQLLERPGSLETTVAPR